MTRTSRLAIAAVAGGMLLGCGRTGAPGPAEGAARTEIAAAMERYQVAARTVNPDSMASFYTPTAVLFEPGIQPIVGRDSIRAFLASFPGASVQSDSISLGNRPASRPESSWPNGSGERMAPG